MVSELLGIDHIHGAPVMGAAGVFHFPFIGQYDQFILSFK